MILELISKPLAHSLFAVVLTWSGLAMAQEEVATTDVAEVVTLSTPEPNAQTDAAVHMPTFYGITLGSPLPEYPECTEDMIWYANGDSPCIRIDREYFMGENKPIFRLLDDAVGIYFNDALRDQGYPRAVVVGLDANKEVVFLREVTGANIEQQDEVIKRLSEELGEPKNIVMKSKFMYPVDEIRAKPEDKDISIEMWLSAENGSKLVVWRISAVWARYVSFTDSSYFEVGLIRILPNGELVEMF